MTYTPIYLRFLDEAEAAARLADYTPVARDDVGSVVQDDVPQPGWHVNLMVEGALPWALQPFVVTPAAPYRRFAGY